MRKALLVLAIAIFAVGGAALVFAHSAERGMFHEDMEEILENGEYADLEELRAQTGMPMMPWVQDEGTFAQWQERHEAMEGLYGEGPRMMRGGCMRW